MKKLQIIAILATFASFISVKGQTNNSDFLTTSFKMPASIAESNKFDIASVMVNKAGNRAVKHFKSYFKDENEVKWFAGKNVITASFKRAEISNCVVYDRNGRWIRNIKSYSENEMPRGIREIVKRSEYFDDRITFVQEIQEDGILLYVVHLENEKMYKQIIVDDGEIRLFSRFNKQ